MCALAVVRPREVTVTSTGKGGAAEGVGGWKEAEVVISKGVAAEGGGGPEWGRAFPYRSSRVIVILRLYLG